MAMADTDDSKLSKIWARPRNKWLLGIPLGGLIAFGLGAIALGTTNYVLHETSSTEFCYNCHSHENFIKPEYEASSHFSNLSGVRAGCSDCHLPHDNWFSLVWTKMVVSLDIVPELAGKLDTAEKYEAHRAEMAESVWRQFKENDSAHRAEMAESVWRQFKENDSQFCRSCHSIDAMDLDNQERRTARQHTRSTENGETCIDCHYGIVHQEPEGAAEIIERLQQEFAPEDPG
jgi:nitrate/TMAO reductase-like tetraheme cytochrome c subunit